MKVLERQLLRLQLPDPQYVRQIRLKSFEFGRYRSTPGHARIPSLVPKPSGDLLDKPVDFPLVRMNILPGDVRDELLISIFLSVEDERFLTRTFRTEIARAKEKAQFKGHVEARQTRRRVQFSVGNIVDAISAFANNTAYFLDPRLAAIVVFSSATRRIAGSHDSEDDGLEKLFIVRRKRTIDKNVLILHPARLAARTVAMASRISFAEKCVASPFGFKMRTPSFVTPRTLGVFVSALAASLRVSLGPRVFLEPFAMGR
ncbi:MAG: hypothetical protein ACR65T_02525 [Methylocystis sp.]|uniref:hypothetical protein n=1 Tax=Methylocystis sp. TaxID=1911079 RepID=UPI003DA4DC79